jgi:arylsulfatase A-like enzyme
MTLKINIFTYFIISFLTLLICSVNAEESETNKPNIIMIVADDLGYNDVGFNGSLEIETPNIDRIAEGGIVFTHGYVTHSICAPSRAAILTGKYQQKFGFEKNPSAIPNSGGVPDSEINLAEVLKMSGYKTAAIGKWHLGSGSNYSPNHRGFDYFFGFERGGSNYYPELLTLNSYSEVTERYGWYNLKILENEKPIEINSYLTDELSSSAVEFVKKTKDSPFFLYLAYNAPHTPMQADQKVYDTIEIKDPSRRTYAAMIKSLDNGIGKVLDILDELNLEKNTMVIFLSDNGGPELTNYSDNGILRGSKSEPYEGGIRVPMAIKWPSVYPAGLIFDKNISSLDFFSTIIESANVDLPNKKNLDGVDLTPCLIHSNCNALDRFLYFRSQSGWKVVLSPHSVKIISHDKSSEFKNTNTESYNLIKDPSEEHSNLNDHRDKYSEMTKNYKLWEKNFPGPAFSGLGSEGFPELTLLFRIKRKINFIIFQLNRNFKTYLGIY